MKHVTAVLMLAATSACAVEEPAGPAYVIEIADGSTLEFWDEDGLATLSGTNPAGALPLYERFDLRGTPAEMFETLRPGDDVPAELLALAWPALGVVEPAGKRAPASLTSSQFQNTHCATSVITHQDNTAKRHVGDCQLNWVGGRWARYNNKAEVYGAVNPTAGTVTFRRSSKYTDQQSFTTTDWTVAQGQVRWANTFTTNDRGIDGQFEVLDASGDTFHVGTVYADKTICYVDYICDFSGGQVGWTVRWTHCDDGTESFLHTGTTCS